jgi:hypothetical protein
MAGMILLICGPGKMALSVDVTFVDLSPGRLPLDRHIEVMPVDVSFYLAPIKALLVIIGLASNPPTMSQRADR